ncbi:MAG: ABC transporter substrate-binding protein [Ilumatobacteraceae bacterium]
MRNQLAAVLAVAVAVAVAGCSGGSASPPTTTEPAPSSPRTTITLPRPGESSSTTPSTGDPTGGPTTTAAPGDWRPDTSDCPDPAATSAPITDTLVVAMSAPLSGGVVAAQWKPIVDGMRTAIDNANFTRALGDLHVELRIVDDRGDPDRTKGVLQSAIDAGAQAVAGVIGTDANLAVRFTLNEQCVPQLLGFSAAPALGDAVDYPWTMGFLPPVDDELGVVATQVAAQLPNGGTLAVYAAAGALGDAYVAAAADLAAASALDVVTTERIDSTSSLPATAAIDAIVTARPDVVVAAPDGLDCTWFLRGLGAARTAAPDWRPLVVLSAGCALPAVMRLAGPLTDGVISASAFADPDAGTDPSDAGMADYVTWMQGAGLAGAASAAVPGWSAGQALVEIVRAAQQSPDGLSQASLITAARHLDVAAPLGRPGVVLRTDGARDPAMIQSMQVVRWSASSGRFEPIGPVVTSRET